LALVHLDHHPLELLKPPMSDRRNEQTPQKEQANVTITGRVPGQKRSGTTKETKESKTPKQKFNNASQFLHRSSFQHNMANCVR